MAITMQVWRNDSFRAFIFAILTAISILPSKISVKSCDTRVTSRRSFKTEPSMEKN